MRTFPTWSASSSTLSGERVEPVLFLRRQDVHRLDGLVEALRHARPRLEWPTARSWREAATGRRAPIRPARRRPAASPDLPSICATARRAYAATKGSCESANGLSRPSARRSFSLAQRADRHQAGARGRAGWRR
jgi:hypothetical protein